MEFNASKLGRAMRRFEDLMSAVSFAEAGEYETAQTLLQKDRRVLLVITGPVNSRRALRYAANFCERINGMLEIISHPALRSRIQPVLDEIAVQGIDYSIIETDGCLKQAVVDHTEQNRNIDYVVLNDEEHLDDRCPDDSRYLDGVKKLLRCPMIVVEA